MTPRERGHVCVIVVPYDSGLYRARMGCGPERLLESGLKPLLARLGHTPVVETVRVSGRYTPEISTTFELCSLVAQRVHECLHANNFPLVLSGNCDISVGAVAGCGCKTTGVAWFDAHGESHTPETTESGFLDGMGLSILTGQCWRGMAGRIPGFSAVAGEQVLLIGSRDVEPQEHTLQDRVGIRRVSAVEDVRSAIESMSRKVDGVYIHLDLDVLDPREATANQWTPPDGLTVETLREAVKAIQSYTDIKGFGIGSYDPECDRDLNALQAACAVAESVLSNGR
jgi:arginase